MQDNLGKRNALHVEGRDEDKCLYELFTKYNLVRELSDFPRLCDQKGFVGVLACIQPSIKSSDGKVQGFVIDANESLEQRWMAVRNQLIAVHVDVPENLSHTGFIGYSEKFKTRVGVWIMPDNRMSGIFEHFLATLAGNSSPLFLHARNATAEARNLGAEFNENNIGKAELYSWLAWQEDPGKPPWMAFYKGYFQQSSELSDAFIAWFKDLYELS